MKTIKFNVKSVDIEVIEKDGSQFRFTTMIQDFDEVVILAKRGKDAYNRKIYAFGITYQDGTYRPYVYPKEILALAGLSNNNQS